MRRRALLASLSTGGVTALAGCLGSAEGSFEPWEPDPGAWPLAQYDGHNSSHNPHASPPRDGATVRWNESVGTPIHELLGAQETLVACGPEGIVARAYADGEELWRHEQDVRAAGIYDEWVYAIKRIDEDDGSTAQLVEFSLADGEERVLSTDFEEPPFYEVLVTDRYVIVGEFHAERAVVIERDSGDEAWEIEEGSVLGLTDEELIVGHAGHLGTYTSGSGILRDQLDTEWGVRTYHGARMLHPTHTDFGILVGERQAGPDYRASVHAYRSENGQVMWTSEPAGSGVSSPVVMDRVCYAVHGWGSQSRAEAHGADIVAMGHAQGGNLWRETVDIDLSRVIASDDLLVVNGNIEGYVAGLDLDGNIQWEFDPPDAGPVIMIEDMLYVGTRGGDLFALEEE